MTLARIGSLALALTFLFLVPISGEAQPGCGNTREPMRAACQAAVKRGVRAISCYRSSADQQRLRNYFYSIGRRGQVARGRSRHQLGLACDFSRNLGSTFERTKRLNSRSHTGNHYSDNGH